MYKKKFSDVTNTEIQYLNIKVKKMKLITSVLLLLATSLFFESELLAQKKPTKAAEKELRSRPMRKARKEARQLVREGYDVAPGALPISRQVENSWIRSIEMDAETGYPKYITANGNAVGESITAAKLQANEIAKFELAGTIATNVAALIEGNIANAQLNTQEAASVTEIAGAIKNLVVQEIGRVLPLLEIYRPVGKNNVEVNIRIGYNSEIAIEAGKKVIRRELTEKTKILHEKLDKLLDFK
ncbi:MAG: hypothetical protein ACK48G_05090 [Chitinophagaceae bacterium]|jgi:hypothetical protein